MLVEGLEGKWICLAARLANIKAYLGAALQFGLDCCEYVFIAHR